MAVLKEEVAVLKKDVAELQESVSILATDMEKVKGEQTRMNLTIENVIQPDIRLLVENYMSAAKKYEKSVEQIEEMQLDIKMMKSVVAEHSRVLQRLA